MNGIGLLSTDTVAASARLPFWRDIVCATFVELDCESANQDGFFGSIDNQALLDLQFSDIRAAPQRVVRSRAKIARSNLDYFLLSLQTSGTGLVTQDDRRAVLQPGDFALYDTTRPYDLTFRENFGQIVIRLPRDAVADRVAGATGLTAVRVPGDHGTGKLASMFLQQLHAQIGIVDAASLGRLQANAIDLLATALAEQSGMRFRAPREPKALLRQRIEAYIEAELGNPELTCEAIAAAHRISSRSLRKLFAESETSLSAWLWQRRLAKAQRDLIDPLRARLSVSAIGYDAGFKDLAHFSRAFRARYGVTPREFRLHGMLGREV